MSVEYIRRANELLSHYSCEQLELPKLTTAKFVAELPSAVKNEVVNTVKSVINKHNRGVCASLPVLRKPVVTWNNQNYKVKDGGIEFPVWEDGKSKRIFVEMIADDYQLARLNGKLGTLRITQ